MISACAWALAASPAASAATCTAEQKEVRARALARFQSQASAARRAYYKRHRSQKLRSAYAKTQAKKLRALRAAAACTVPPLPPSSGASCSFMLDDNANAVRTRGTISGELHEGPLDRTAFFPAFGAHEAALVFVDFPDAPGGAESPASIVSPHTNALDYFPEVSYGRFSLSITPIERWIRMPQPISYYDPPLGSREELRRFMRDVVAAADQFVDFARYEFLFIVPSRGWLSSNSAVHHYAGYGYPTSDGRELRFGAIFSGDTRRFGNGTAFVVHHEFLHTTGLVDLGGFVNSWDPMGPSTQTWPSGAHLLGWHKWRLGWLDPPQLTCLTAPGSLEETVTPIAVAGGKKLVVVPVTGSVAYVVEARRWVGYDKHACEEGVLVYTVNSQLGASAGAIIIKGPARCGPSPGAHKTGGVFEDEHVKVEVLATDGRDYRVRVTKK